MKNYEERGIINLALFVLRYEYRAVSLSVAHPCTEPITIIVGQPQDNPRMAGTQFKLSAKGRPAAATINSLCSLAGYTLYHDFLLSNFPQGPFRWGFLPAFAAVEH